MLYQTQVRCLKRHEGEYDDRFSLFGWTRSLMLIFNGMPFVGNHLKEDFFFIFFSPVLGQPNNSPHPSLSLTLNYLSSFCLYLYCPPLHAVFQLRPEQIYMEVSVHHRETCSHWIHQMYSRLISPSLFPSLLGKDMIEMYFDFRLFRLWKTRQHSKLLDYEDLLWPRAGQCVALRAGRPTVKLHSTSFHFGVQEEEEWRGTHPLRCHHCVLSIVYFSSPLWTSTASER